MGVSSRSLRGISPVMFKPLIGKGHPEFSIRRQQIDNNGEDGVLYLDIFNYKLQLFPAEVHGCVVLTSR